MASNAERWNEWEKATGKKRPPYIDGVGNLRIGRLEAPHERKGARRAAREAAAKKAAGPAMVRQVAQVQPMRQSNNALSMPLSSIQQWRAPRMNFDAPQMQPFRKWR